jgi:hypothetical protein
MPTEDRSPGRPFPGDHPDPRTAQQREQEQRKVRRSVTNLTSRARDPVILAEQILLVQKRRAGRDDLAQLMMVPSQQRPREPFGWFETLAVKGELLVRHEVLWNPQAREIIDPHEFTRRSVECLDGRVVRLVNPELSATELADVARALRKQGFPASVSHITPLGGIIKQLASPEPSSGALGPPRAAGPGRGVQVAVIDTGIAGEVRRDGWLDGVARADNVDPLDVLPDGPDGFLDFGAGHGTFSTGVVQQVAPGADIRMHRAVDTDGISGEVDVACAMVRAVQEGARVINLSLGTHTLDDQPPVAIETALEIIGEIEERTGKQALVVAAAGNLGTARPCWPAAFGRVVAVAGLTADGSPAPWSNRGSWVDCLTVAEGVVSTYVAGKESPQIDPEPDEFGDGAWAVWSGTSFAAPQVAGAVARISQESGLEPNQALEEVVGHGTPVPNYGLALEILPGTSTSRP